MSIPGPPLALTGFLPAWDVELRHADVSPIAAWALDRIRSLGHRVSSLATLHHRLDAEQARALAQALTAASLEGELRRRVHRAVIAALPELPSDRVWIQTHAHFRILAPHDEIAPVPAHTDYGLGHSLSERNVWLSLTDAQDRGAFRVLPLRDSLAWMGRTGRVRGVVDDPPDIPAVPTRAGDVLLFTPLHLHCAKAPSADACRVSVDVRLVPRPPAMRDLTFSPLYLSSEPPRPTLSRRTGA